MASGGTAVRLQRFKADDDAPEYLHDALKDIGLQESIMVGRQRRSNPAVERFIEKVSGERQDATNVPWCAYFVGAKLEYQGIPCTKSGMARSYLRWGTEVSPKDWRQGDIAVFIRGRKDDGVLGHVAFLLEWDEETVTVVGGNQGDQVSIQTFSRNRLLGVRRPRGVVKSHTMRAAVGSAITQTAAKAIETVTPEPTAVAAKVEAAAQAAEQAKGPLEALAPMMPKIVIVLSAISIGLALYAAYCRFSDHKSGQNN